MHTAAKQPSEPTSATTATDTQSAEEILAHVKAIYRIKRLESEVTMIAAQTKAMEALVHCMTPIKSTGDTKLDAFYARERDRQRLAAIQTLLHIRTVQREKRLRKAMRAKQKAKPNRAERAAERSPKGAMVGAEGAGHADNGSTVANPAPSPQRGRRWSCADSARDRMRVRSESSGCSECGMLKQRLSMDPSETPRHAQTSLSMPPTSSSSRKRSRYKTRKPKHPKQPRRRKS